MKNINRTPLVSCIMIFFNAQQEFFEEAIASIFAQTYENWELLLVDDGSTNNSTKIALKYVKQDPRVRYLEHQEHQNLGMSASRNFGINQAKGEYIAFLDSDDIWLSQKLQRQVELLATNTEAAMVCGRSQYWYSWTGNPQDLERDRLQTFRLELNTLVQPPQLLTLLLQNKLDPLATCSVLIRRELIETVGGFEDSFHGMFEDQAFFSKVLLKAPIYIESGFGDRYRQHEKSTCYVAPDRYSGYENFLNWLEKYLLQQGVREPEIWQALNKKLFPYRHPYLYYLSKQIKDSAKIFAKRFIPSRIQALMKATWRKTEYCPPAGTVKSLNLKRVTPFSHNFGADRGLPIDRYYIEKFLTSNAEKIRGHVLEVGDAFYTRRFGSDRVIRSDVLNLAEGAPQATIIADLANAPHLPSNTFDCFILTQTLQYVYDLPHAIKTIYRILKPGGVVLVTLPGFTPVTPSPWTWYWGFTTVSAQQLFADIFGADNIQVESFGNVAVASAFLYGLSTQELQQQSLDYCDPTYQMLITVKAVKAEETL